MPEGHSILFPAFTMASVLTHQPWYVVLGNDAVLVVGDTWMMAIASEDFLTFLIFIKRKGMFL